MKKFKIIITLGPASLNKEFLQFCKNHHLNNFRLNSSYLSSEEIENYLQHISRYFKDFSYDIFLDLQGNKKRIGQFKGIRKLNKEQVVYFTLLESSESQGIPLPSPEIFTLAEIGDIILLQDGSIILQITEKQQGIFKAKVLSGGELRGGSGIVIQNKSIATKESNGLESNYIKKAQKFKIKNLALSYVSSEKDVLRLRQFCNRSDYNPLLIAKIERPEALQNLKDICHVADEIWFCRGDLGTSIPLRELWYWQTKVIETTKTLNKPVYIAGQVFQYLTHFAEPTRTEVVHFSQLLQQNVDGIVLSDETAIGKNPQKTLIQIMKLL